MYKIAIQCKDEHSGKKGSFLYLPEYGHIAMSTVYKDLVALFDSPLYQHLWRLGQVEK